ncbi:MAG TPA: prepilin peptidase [Nanoarchaeota archaeon]|nr:prepilin peptidase [Nanoarchaeota archaeon]HIJ05114.1 prepilin peptidase [Nanoarchaeota archaeon]
MVLEIIFFILSLSILLLASIFDLKTREVPDYLSYGFLISVLGISLLYSIYTRNIFFFLYSCAGGIIIFSLSYVLYRAKQMGGADAKILTALGAIFANYSLGNIPLLFIFLLFLVGIGSLYTFSWGTVLYLKSWKRANKKAKDILREKKSIRLALVIFVLLLLIVTLFISNENIKTLLAVIALLSVSTFYLFIFIQVVESIHFIVRIPLEKITEGDWLAKEVKVNGKCICSTKAPCLDKKQIEAIKKAKVDFVFIKVGIPFVPAITCAAIATFIFIF